MFQRTLLGLAILFGLVLATNLMGQENQGEADKKGDAEVIIINQDGERVDPGELKKRIVVGQDGKSAGITVTAKDGKITIVDKDGKKREIDVSDAQSITINQAVKTIEENGEQKSVSSGKAIIVGADGVRHEIELDGAMGLGDAANLFMFKDGLPKGVVGKLRTLPRPLAGLELPGAVWAEPANVGKYMIGVNCATIPDSLRAHLDLDEGVGLIVESLSDETPAAKAGIRRHDILMNADDKQLTSVDDLIDAVQLAGENEKPLSVTGIRAGKEVSFKITPVERPAGQMGMRVHGGKPFKFEFQDLGPGMILDEGFGGAQDFEAQLKQMREQMQEMQEMMKQRFGPEGDELKELMKKAMEGAIKDGNFQFDFEQKSDKDSDQQSNRSGDKS